MYEIITQGTNDILDIRNGVREVLEIKRAAKQQEQTKLSKGQQTLMDWVIDTNGRTGAVRMEQRRDEEQEDETEEDASSVMTSDTLAEFDWTDDMVEGIPDEWIPIIGTAEQNIMKEQIAAVEHPLQVVANVDSYNIQLKSMRHLMQGDSVDSTIIDGYLRLLQSRSTNRLIKCMGSCFLKRLYNPGGEDKHRPSDTVDLAYVSSYTKGIDIFAFQTVLIPVLVKSHWSLIAVDLETKQIRYLDSQQESGVQYLAAVKRWVASEWDSKVINEDIPFPADNWRVVPSTPATIPQQQDKTSCGIFLLMFAESLADGKDVGRCHQDFCGVARRYFAWCLLSGTTTKRNKPPKKPGASSPIRSRRRNVEKEKLHHNFSTVIEAETTADDEDTMIDSRNGPTEDRLGNDMELALQSTEEGQWLTDVAIRKYFELLQNRSRLNNTKCMFVSTDFFTRIYDMTSDTIRPIFREHAESIRNTNGLTELEELRATHDFVNIFRCSRVYVPVGQPQHWGLLEINIDTRTVGYIDSLRSGEDKYIIAMQRYMVQLEEEVRGESRVWWGRITVPANARGGEETAMYRVPRQENGNDCGIFVCAFADMLERDGDIKQVTQSSMPEARRRLLRSLETNVALVLTGSAGVVVTSHIETERHKTSGSDANQAITSTSTRIMRTPAGPVQYNEHSPVRMTSKKLRRLRNIKADTCKLAIGPSQQYEGGEELYLDQKECKRGTILAYYTGKIISEAEKAKSASKYIFEIPSGTGDSIFIDAADPTCGYARYSDDAMRGETENAKWEVMGTGSGARLALVAITTILQGMPIRAPYGWQYWYSPENFPKELMQKAFVAYIDDVAADENEELAWAYASAIGYQDALIKKWGGNRGFDTTEIKDEVEIQNDQSQEEDMDATCTRARGVRRANRNVPDNEHTGTKKRRQADRKEETKADGGSKRESTAPESDSDDTTSTYEHYPFIESSRNFAEIPTEYITETAAPLAYNIEWHMMEEDEREKQRKHRTLTDDMGDIDNSIKNSKYELQRERRLKRMQKKLEQWKAKAKAAAIRRARRAEKTRQQVIQTEASKYEEGVASTCKRSRLTTARRQSKKKVSSALGEGTTDTASEKITENLTGFRNVDTEREEICAKHSEMRKPPAAHTEQHETTVAPYNLQHQISGRNRRTSIDQEQEREQLQQLQLPLRLSRTGKASSVRSESQLPDATGNAAMPKVIPPACVTTDSSRNTPMDRCSNTGRSNTIDSRDMIANERVTEDEEQQQHQRPQSPLRPTSTGRARRASTESQSSEAADEEAKTNVEPPNAANITGTSSQQMEKSLTSGKSTTDDSSGGLDIINTDTNEYRVVDRGKRQKLDVTDKPMHAEGRLIRTDSEPRITAEEQPEKLLLINTEDVESHVANSSVVECLEITNSNCHSDIGERKRGSRQAGIVEYLPGKKARK